jgi:RNA polymerase sigma-70 factor (ECF subfamily)
VELSARAPARTTAAWDWARLRRSAGLEARRLLRDPDAAEDAAQEAMIRAWRQRDSCRSPEAPEGWLRQIARNEALRQRSRSRELEPLPEDEAASAVSPEEQLVDRIDVTQALHRLRKEDRTLVVLRYQLDLPDVAIAERLGIAQSTVRVKLHRLRRELRVLMNDLR